METSVVGKGFNALAEPSVLTERLFVTNPQYLKFDGLVDVDLLALYESIDLNDPLLMEHLESNPEVIALLDGIIDDYEKVPEVAPSMPPCPQPQQLYKRIGESAQVIDLGSGDGKKAAKCQAKIKMVDKNPGSEHVKPMDVDDMRFSDIDTLYTTFNSITQFKKDTVEELLSVEGLHVLPDLEYIKDEMGSVRVGECTYETVHNGKVYLDQDHGLVGDEITTGYIGLNSYKRENIEMEFGGVGTTVEEFAVPVSDTKNQLPGEVTPKYDGIAMRLRRYKGDVVVLSERSGKGYVYHTTAPRMDLLLERVPKEGPPKAFVLLRVIEYKGRIPFHGINALRLFVSRVKIKIDGIDVVAPGDMILQDIEVDGFIYRIEGHDFRLKNETTVDVTWDQIITLRDMKALDIYFVGEFDKGKLLEFAVTRHRNGRFVFRFVGYRVDKKKPTSNDAVLKYMDMAMVEVDDVDFSEDD